MRLAKSVPLYFFTFFFNAAVSFGTFSIISYHLDEEDFGIINLYNAVSIFLIPFISIGTQFVLSVDYFKLTRDAYKKHFSNGILIPVVMTVLFTVLALFVFYPVSKLIGVNFFFVLILPAFCLLTVIYDITLGLIRNKERHVLFSIYTIGKSLLEVALTLGLILGLSMNWQGRLSSAALTLIVVALVSLYLMKRWDLLGHSIQRSEIRQIAKVGLPFIPERLAIFVIAYSAGFFINAHNGIGDVGYYGAGMQIATVVNVSILALISMFQPYIFKNLASPTNYANLRKATFGFIGISFFITASIVLATPLFFKYLIGPSLQPGQIYAKYLSAGYFFWSIYGVFVSYLLFLKKNNLIMLISIGGTLLSIVLNSINVKNYGAMGAAYTSMIVYFLMATTVIFFVNRHYNLVKILWIGKKTEVVEQSQ